MQTLSNINFDTYSYSFSDLMGNGNGGGLGNGQQRNMMPMGAGGSMQLIGDQGLSPPYSNHSPPHSVHSSSALSPQGCIGEDGELLEYLIRFENGVDIYLLRPFKLLQPNLLIIFEFPLVRFSITG